MGSKQEVIPEPVKCQIKIKILLGRITRHTMNPVFFSQIDVLGTVARLEARQESKARPEKITLKL